MSFFRDTYDSEQKNKSAINHILLLISLSLEITIPDNQAQHTSHHHHHDRRPLKSINGHHQHKASYKLHSYTVYHAEVDKDPSTPYNLSLLPILLPSVH